MSVPNIDETHDPALRSWVSSANGHADFPIQNLPLGVFSPPDGDPRPGAAIGDRILDLSAAASLGLLSDSLAGALGDADSLNPLFALPAYERSRLRKAICGLLSDASQAERVTPLLYAAQDCRMSLPMRIGDYTDFYVGIHHAQNIGKLFRPDNPLLPNYKYVPIGYHGRASSVRPSGEPVRRPKGQIKLPDAEVPMFAPTRRLDYELELGVWIGRGNDLGQSISIAEAIDHVAGLSLFNDWSTRDVQAWEYQPLGPFLSKNFHSTISPWIVTTEALLPFRTAQASRPDGDPQPLPYLWSVEDQATGAFALDLEVRLLSERMRADGLAPHRLSKGPASNMYWTVAQMIAHHTSGGCNLATGDLLGTGTLSGPDVSSFGSLSEITRGGAESFELPSGEARTFLADGDEIIFSGRAQAPGFVSIGFGECRAVVLAAS